MNQSVRRRRFVQLLRVLTLGALVVTVLAPPAAGAQTAGSADDEPDVVRVEPGGAPPPGSGALDIVDFARAIDGSTLETWYANNRIGIGIIGIDVPQGNTDCGAAATNFLQNLVFGGLHLEEDTEIPYGRHDIRMYYMTTPDGTSLAAAMVAAGYARANGQGAEAATLAALEEQARANQAGCLWGEPAPPADAPQAEARPLQGFEWLLPAGFSMETVVGNLDVPTTFAFLPDGRMLIGEKAGVIRVFDGEDVLPEPFLDLSDQVNDYWDRGLLDIAVDPNFESNGYVYILYTYEHDADDYSGTKTGRLLRVTASDATASPGSEEVLLGAVVGDSCEDFPAGADCIPSDSPGHSTGGLAFAPDGNLFVTLGDGSSFNNVDPLALRTQNLDSLAGKLLRITPAGAGLPTNPFYTGAPDDNRSKVWAFGLRNGYRLTAQAGSGLPYFGDVGWNNWEEINAAQPGANLGWPCYEGPARQAGYEGFGVCQSLYNNGTETGPLVTWEHEGFSTAATGGIFYTGAGYPAEFQGAYFYGDYGQGFIRYLPVDGSGQVQPAPQEFLEDAAGPVKFASGPNGDIYYLSINSGQIRRFVYNGVGPAAEIYLSDVNFVSAANGYGPVERDSSNGEDGSGDGGPLTLNGTTYERGLGVHATSDILVFVDGACQLFTADIGIDDEVDSRGSVTFEVWADGVQLYESDTLTGLSETQSLALDITGVTELRLLVTDAGDGPAYDHSDWAIARLNCGSDEEAPQVLSVAPEDGATDVAVNTEITVAFDEPLDAAGLDGNVELREQPGGAPVALTTEFDGATNVLTIALTERLDTSTQYQLTLRGGAGGITDLTGNPLAADHVTAFTTAAVGAPVATILTPTDGQLFAVGDVIGISGSAVDGNGAPLPESAYLWKIRINHCEPQDCHIHQLLNLPGVSAGEFVVPDHGGDYFFEIELEVTDQFGFSDTRAVAILPRTVDVTLDSVPAGLAVALSGEPGTGAMTRPVVVGSTVTLSTPSPQGTYAFTGWSDGGEQLHNVVIGESDVTYTATFEATAQALYLSDLPWQPATNGWGAAERDRSNGEQGPSDGGPLAIQGVGYAKGIGAHALSSIEVAVPATCTVFQAAVGIDDEVPDGASASVRFEVWVDGLRQYQSATVTPTSAAVAVAVDVAGAGVVRLVVDPVGGNSWDHADWGEARFLCGDAEPPVDETPPTVQSVTPANGSTLVPITGSVQVTFSEPMNQAATEAAFNLAPAAGGSFSWNAAGSVMTYTPAAPLTAGQLYTATIASGASDPAGNALASQYSWSFTTLAATGGESLVRVNAGGPAFTGATGLWSADTAFSGGGNYVTGGAVANTTDDALYRSERFGTFSYSFTLPNGDYQVNLKFAEIYWTSAGQRVFDVRINGQLVLDNFDILAETSRFSALDKTFPVSVTNGSLAISFVTVVDNAKASAIEVVGISSGPDTTPPTVQSVAPAAGATNVPLSAGPQATFSEALAAASVTGNAVLRETGGAVVASTATYDAATRTIRVTPAAALEAETSYTVELNGGTGGITDVAGNALASDYSWSFTTLATTGGESLVRVNAGGPAFTGTTGLWSADTGFSGGGSYVTGGAVANTTDDALYQSERFGTFSYSFTLPNGDYQVNLKFAEIYWTSAGQRVFDVRINGQLILANFDILAETSRFSALDKSFPAIVTNGTLSISFVTVTDNAKVSAIEISGVPSGPDTVPPTVTTVNPANAATNVALTTVPQATFNETLNPATVTGNAVLRVTGGADVTATVSYDAATRSVRLTPAAALTADTSYTVELNGGTGGLADAAGNTLASDYSWSFTTVAAAGAETLYLSDLPWQSATNGWGAAERDRSNGEQGSSDGGPLAIQGVGYAKGIGAHAASSIEVAIPATCSVFQAAVGIDDEVPDGASASVRFEVWVDGARQYQSATLTPTSAAVAVEVDVAGAGVVRLVADPVGGNSWDHADWGEVRFLCGDAEPPVDETPPTVQNVTPAANATGVERDVTPEATFNEALDADSVAGNAVLRVSGGSEVVANVTYDAVSRTLTVTPAEALEPATTYTVELTGGTGGLTDVAGNALASDYSWSFTTGSAPLAFSAPVGFAAGLNAHSATVADLNADGNLDAVVANSGPDTVSVFLGNGLGSFAPGVTYPTGDKPKHAAIADMNGDGYLDLVVANEQSSNVSVLLGDGSGAFTTLGAYAACVNPHHLTVAQLDAGGALDVVVACWGGQNARVLLGAGAGSLLPQAPIALGGAPHSVVAVDLDDDGVTDLAVANHGSSEVNVLLGAGDGSFPAVVDYPVGSQPHSIAAGDFDGDDRPDLVTANEGNNNVSVLFGNGDGTFQGHETFAAGSVPKTVAVGDLNDDGRLDIVTANSAGNYPDGSTPTDVSVLLNDGSGGFLPPSHHPTGLTPFGLALGDFNEDGLLDIVTANWHTNNLTLLLQE